MDNSRFSLGQWFARTGIAIGAAALLVTGAAWNSISGEHATLAVLDDASIDRADFLGYGIGGRVALDMAAFAPQRVRAVAAGATHPFAERMQLWRDALADGHLESWVNIIAARTGGLSATTRRRLLANDPAIAPRVLAAYVLPTVRPLVRSTLETILMTSGNNAPSSNVRKRGSATDSFNTSLSV